MSVQFYCCQTRNVKNGTRDTGHGTWDAGRKKRDAGHGTRDAKCETRNKIVNRKSYIVNPFTIPLPYKIPHDAIKMWNYRFVKFRKNHFIQLYFK